MMITKREDKAVSPIIATILLIAITIVLAATLYSLLGGYVSIISSPTPIASMTVSNSSSPAGDLASYSIYISGINGNISLNKVDLEIENSSGDVAIVPLATGTFNVQDWTIVVNGPPYLSSLTIISIKATASNYIKYVKLIDIVTGGTIASQSISSI